MEIKKFQPTNHRIKALIYGKPGTGKTTFGGTAPKALFLSAEGGLLSIASKTPDFVTIDSLKALNEALDYLRTQPHDYETVVIDSITEINEVIKAEIEKKNGRAISKNDWVEVQNKIKKIIRSFRDLPMHVLVLALENTEKDEDKIVAITPSLNGKAATDLAAYMDIVGYLYLDKVTGERRIMTRTNNILVTKDRSNILPEEPSLNFNEWVGLIQGMQTGEMEKVAEHHNEATDLLEDEDKKKLELKKNNPITTKMTEKTQKELFACWAEMWKLLLEKKPLERGEDGLLKYTDETEETVRRGTMQSSYGVTSSTNLIEADARDFIKKLRSKIAGLTELDIPFTTPGEIDEARAADKLAREELKTKK